MAVRFDADGEDYTRALALGAQTAYTVCCWGRLAVDRNTWSTLWSLDNGTGDVDVLQTSDDGVSLGLYSDGNNPVVVVMTVGSWYFVGVSRSGTGGTAYHRTGAATTLTTVDLAGSSATTNVATLRIGESPFAAEWLNGNVAAFKLWNVALTAAEVEVESRQYVPNRVANLVSFHPLVRAETTDYSGNARTLSGGVGATTEDGPPLTWRGASPRLVLPSGAPTTTVNVPIATATGDALALSAAVGALATTATAAGVAQPVATTLGADVAPATGVGAANGPAASVATDVGAATASGVALDATVSTDVTTNVPVPTATATGVATDVVVTTTVNGGAATGVSAALDAAVATSESASVGVAPAAGAALDATTTQAVDVAAGAATATGVAGDGVPNVGPAAVVATSTVTAGDAEVTVDAVVPVPTASGVGVAHGALVTTGNDAVAQPATAAATGAALGPATTLTVVLTTAGGVGVTLDATTLTAVAAPVAAAAVVGAALDPTVVVDPDQAVLVGVAAGTVNAYDVAVTGGLPPGRIRISGSEPTTRLTGRATREPTSTLSGREPRTSL